MRAWASVGERTLRRRDPVTNVATKQASRPSSQGGHQLAIVSRVGPVEIDWPRSLGYFGGIGLAVGIGLIDPPVGAFIAAVPFLKMLNRRRAATPSRFVGQIFEGLSKPVGGDSEGTIRLVGRQGSSGSPVD